MTMGEAEERRPLLNGNLNYCSRGERNYRTDVELNIRGYTERNTVGLNYKPYREHPQKLRYSWKDLRVSPLEKANDSTWDRLKGAIRRNRRISRMGKQILKNVSGIVYSGEVTAIMGSCGAGKTTLLDSLTFRTKSNLVTTGDRLLNGHPISRTVITGLSAYVQQEDLFLESLTVREHLIFQAMVRMDECIPRSQRIRRVDEVIQELGLTKCKDTTIRQSNVSGGISGGERKRLSFASEVLTDPPMMFCDEPTSGLDSVMALNVISVLKALADKGKMVAFTVHQPSSEMYGLFDKIILLAEGRTAFLGSRDEASAFFREIGIPCPLNYNPADYYIQVLAVVPLSEDSSRENISIICDSFEQSTVGLKVMSEVGERNELQEQEIMKIFNESLWIVPRISPYKARWMSQFRAVLWRSWLCVIKDPMLVKMRLFQNVVVSMLISILYFRQKMNQIGVFNINGVLFTFLTNMTFQNIYAVITVFCSEQPVFLREHFNGMYRVDVYFLCKTLAEIPIFLVLPVTSILITYYAVGLNPGIGHFFYAVLIVILTANAATSFGYFMSAISGSVTKALSIGPPVIIPFLLFGGYLLNLRAIPSYFTWLSYLSWFRYGNEALLINQWSDIDSINCTMLNSTCPRSGKLVLEMYDFHTEKFTFDLISLFVLIISFRVAAFLSLLYKTLKR